MIDQFESILLALLDSSKNETAFSFVEPSEFQDGEPMDTASIAQSINTAFLISLIGNKHSDFERARHFLERISDSEEWMDIVQFYMKGIDRVHHEIDEICQYNTEFADRLKELYEWTSNKNNLSDRTNTEEKLWSVFFPEACNIRGDRQDRVQKLRKKRTVTITAFNPEPITNVAKQIFFASNVLLTIPAESNRTDNLPFTESLREKLLEIAQEPQLCWFDHPIQIGVKPENNELIYGLRGLQEAFVFEHERGNISGDEKPVCILSVSVTHKGLSDIARAYIEEELSRSDVLNHMDIYAFTEVNARRIIDEVLASAATHYLKRKDASECLSVFGVDGEYGRHYSFLKAIAPFLKIFLYPALKATFKIDLDQVFPQKELLEQTGASAFDHFKTPLWGAHGIDADGNPLDLGMIAGVVVNESDIGQSIFTPDVQFPDHSPSPDELIFYSRLPQALSTEAEMMARYTGGELDGKSTCIQRIHVLGGMNGILIDSLRRYGPFTPSFIGRAEDQAYLISVLTHPDTRLAYVHKDGLIMRHDKEAFAQEAIQSAFVSQLIGDYIRILYFSTYAGILTDDIAKLKETLDPFTGCFISRMPISVVFLRFCLKAASFFTSGDKEQGIRFIKMGAERIEEALNFISGKNSLLKKQYEKERRGWDLYYETLSAIEDGLKHNDPFAIGLRKKAISIIEQCVIRQ